MPDGQVRSQDDCDWPSRSHKYSSVLNRFQLCGP